MNLCELVSQSASNIASTFDFCRINNDIHPFIEAEVCEYSLTTVLYGLMTHALYSTTGNAVHISAKKFNDIILVHIKYKEATPVKSLDTTIEKIKPIAETIGGCLYTSHSNSAGTTLSFTFLNRRLALSA